MFRQRPKSVDLADDVDERVVAGAFTTRRHCADEVEVGAGRRCHAGAMHPDEAGDRRGNLQAELRPCRVAVPILVLAEHRVELAVTLTDAYRDDGTRRMTNLADDAAARVADVFASERAAVADATDGLSDSRYPPVHQ